MENRPNGFTAYDYKEVAVEADRASMTLDGYENFGWKPDENFPEMMISSQKSRMLVRMKRDRKIINKAELTRLQRNFESCIEQIKELEYSKKLWSQPSPWRSAWSGQHLSREVSLR